MKKTIKIVIILLVLGGAAYGVWRWRHQKDTGPTYRTAKVQRGDLVKRISATGTLNPLVNVQVGSQVSGILSKIYVDFNSKVKEGQLLAELDPVLLEASLKQTEGDYLSAKANVASAKLVLDRAQELFEKKIGPQSDRDDAQAKHDSAMGSLKRAEGTKQKAEADLTHTRIYSPIDGIVTSRAVDVGQTVAASLSAPTLFTIAKDLTQMQIDTNVDEADIGQVREGQKATFTVDAYPGESFQGKVVQIRNSPTNVQNVVTYDVIISVDNSNLKLKPGMTANVALVVAEAKDVVKLPNAALRFRPVDADSHGKGETRESRGGDGEKGHKRSTAYLPATIVWVLGGEKQPEKHSVELGFSDGQFTEAKSGVIEGEEVVVGYLSMPSSGSQSPFMPFGGGRRL